MPASSHSSLVVLTLL